MEELLSALKAAAEPTRLRLLALLTHGELSVSELTQILAQSQPRISRHLKLLTDAGLITRCREGAWAFYRLAEQGQHDALARLLVDEIRGDEPVVARDRERLKAVRATRAEAAAAYFRANAAHWDEIRTLYLTESEVEAAMLDLIGPDPLDSMIDLGTGTGRVLEIFAPVARRAIGFDVNHEMLTVARANLAEAALSHCQVRHGDRFGLPAGTGPADLVTLHQVLHYLDDPAGAVAEAARLVAPGGRLLIVDFLPHDFEFLRSQHAHRRLGFSPQEVAGWCRQAGLRASPPRTLPPEGPGLTVALWCAKAARVVRPAQLVAE
jgi:ArsR family transcriptional regulator